MPRTKQFEYMNFNDFIFGLKEVSYMDMYEISEHFYKHILQVYKYIEEGKVVSIEIPEEECMYHVKRESSENFFITKVYGGPIELKEYSPIELVNWLFAKAPWIGMVGYSNKKE